MNPAARLSIALLVALVLWVPTFTATMRGDVELHDAAIRYLVAFVFARIAIGGIGRLIDGYASADHADEAPATPQRRRTDVPSAAGPS